MDKFQASFEILHFLSAIDGEVSDSELDIIIGFLKSNQGKIDFDPGKVIKSINLLNLDGKIDELKRAALIFKDTSSAQDRIILLDFALSLIAADGKITEEESKLFNILGNTWNIDIKSYLESKQ